jgi:hypothetical protein
MGIDYATGTAPQWGKDMMREALAGLRKLLPASDPRLQRAEQQFKQIVV